MGKKELGKDRVDETQQEAYSSMVNHNTILLSFEGWIKYIEGFCRGLQTTKTVDAAQVLDCVGEIMEYMKTLRLDILDILQHCENVLDKDEQLEEEIKQLKQQIDTKLLPTTVEIVEPEMEE